LKPFIARQTGVGGKHQLLNLAQAGNAVLRTTPRRRKAPMAEGFCPGQPLDSLVAPARQQQAHPLFSQGIRTGPIARRLLKKRKRRRKISGVKCPFALAGIEQAQTVTDGNISQARGHDAGGTRQQVIPRFSAGEGEKSPPKPDGQNRKQQQEKYLPASPRSA
jgi:hypothetical protein